ncbi:hypothetical protein [Psychrobacter sp.]|uniref:hypothetical protein n=1 Tax=Psychrobacter sp. TaxID=56811 RepID=UPI003BAE5803
MTITPTQMTAISSQLAVDLSSQSTDRLIELCLLHRAAPDALPSFVVALETEIQRRFTSAEIASNDVMFSVLQNFLNQFASPVPYFQLKMIQMAATVNRDIWFQNNADLFATSINDVDVMTWLITQPDILDKCLNNSFGLTMLAQSTTASTAILTHDPAVTLWKQATNLWSIWPNHTAGMTVLAKSSELMSYVAASSTAMTAVIASSTAMTAVIASSTAMTAVAASSTAMTAVAASSTAMIAVAASSTALSKIVVSTPARNALMTNNAILQSVRQQIRSTITTNWVMQRSVSGVMDVNTPASAVNPSVANPPGFVLASLGFFAGASNGKTEAAHPNGIIAATGGTSPSPNNLSQFDVISFNGVIFTARSNHGAVYAQLWSPN